MSEHKGLLSSGLGMVLHNKRYIVWFYVLNLFLGLFGTVAFVNQAGTILEHSLHSDRLVHGFSVTVLIDMFARPEFGPTMASRGPAMFLRYSSCSRPLCFSAGFFRDMPRPTACPARISSAPAAGICGGISGSCWLPAL